jgi:hypothetical protein
MKAILHILDQKSGNVRSQPYEWDESNPEASEFLWSEGQNCCDCNRSLFFAWAVGLECNEPAEHDADNFLVKITDTSGSTLYQDDDYPPLP